MITKKPSSVIAEEGEKVTLVCKVSGLPIPTIKWQKPLGHLPRGRTAVIDGNMTILSVTKKDTGAYVCSVKNLLGEDSALAVITVIDRLKFTLTPPLKVGASVFNNLMLNCKAQGALERSKKARSKKQEARVAIASCNSYASFVLSKLPACIHNSIYAR